jgi:PAS domain S-box-containing protein
MSVRIPANRDYIRFRSISGFTRANLLTSCLLISAIFLSIAFVRELTIQKRYAGIHAIEDAITIDVGKIIHLDEVLTKSAKMNAATENRRYEARYKSFEPELDAAVKRVIALSEKPGISDTAALAKAVDESNKKLVDMEYRSFEMVSRGEAKAALALLESEEYVAHKKKYADSVNRLFKTVRDDCDRDAEELGSARMRQVGVYFFIVAILFVMWIGLIISVSRATKYENELRRSRDSLEEKVEERTATISELKRQMEFILGATKTGLDIIDEDYNIIYIDPEWQKVYGDPKGRKCYEYFMGKATVCPGCGVTRAFETKETVVTEEILTREGNRPIQVTTIPFRDSSGKWLVAEINVDITEHKRMEDELRRHRDDLQGLVYEQLEAIKETSSRFRTLFEEASDGILIADPDTRRFSMCNNAITKMLGYSREELLGMSVDDIHPKESLPHVLEQFRRQSTGEIRLAENLPTRRKDGSVFFADVTVSHLMLDGKKTLLGSFRDITVRKKAEEDIARSEERFRTIFEQAPLGVALIDSLTGHIYAVNPKFADIAGRTRDEMATIDWMSITHPDDVQKDLDNMALMNAGKTSGFVMNKRYIKPDGSIVWINMTIAPLRVEEGSKPRHLCMIEDITGRRKMEEAIIASEASYRSIFESANDAIIVRDINTYMVIEANKRAGEMFCCPVEKLAGTDLRFVAADSSEHSIETLKGHFDKAARGEPQLFEWTVKDLAGREFWVEINVRRAIIRGGFRLLSVVRDITDRRRAIELKNEFMNTVSHELRTPLGIIKEGVSLVLDGNVGTINAKQAEMLDMAKHNVDRLTRLINQVLDFQKLDAGKMEFRFEEGDINELVNEIHRHTLSLVGKKKLKYELRLGEGLPRIRFDRDRIVEVMTNLINNALKATEKGAITISTALENGSVKVSVADTGHGIKEDDMPKLFQRFAQLERKPGGTGLGLAICKEIIAAHKGEIWAESEWGKGSKFSFTLPV